MSAWTDLAARPKLRFGWLWWAVGWALIALTFRDSLERDVPSFAHMFPSDKILHYTGYFLLALWFAGVTHRKRYAIVGVLLICMGGLIEILQGAMNNGREADWFDFMANSLGIVTGLAIAYAGLGMWMVWVERLFRLQK
ncbi:MAG TPA: VanZ family protein [Steroidobacteraceae bacterium]|nr:VanZ family protein [Steroidobacteraceae bacterium]